MGVDWDLRKMTCCFSPYLGMSDPDKECRRVDERKVKIGGKDKREPANARADSYVENIESSTIPGLDKKVQKISIKAKRNVKAPEHKQADEVY